MNDWHAHAACANTPNPDAVFFPSTGEPHQWDAARLVCARCPVIDECRAYIDRIEGAASWQALRECGMYASETPLQRVNRRRKARKNAFLEALA